MRVCSPVACTPVPISQCALVKSSNDEHWQQPARCTGLTLLVVVDGALCDCWDTIKRDLPKTREEILFQAFFQQLCAA